MLPIVYKLLLFFSLSIASSVALWVFFCYMFASSIAFSSPTHEYISCIQLHPRTYLMYYDLCENSTYIIFIFYLSKLYQLYLYYLLRECEVVNCIYIYFSSTSFPTISDIVNYRNNIYQFSLIKLIYENKNKTKKFHIFCFKYNILLHIFTDFLISLFTKHISLTQLYKLCFIDL